MPQDVSTWDSWCSRLADEALALAAGCDDAVKAARLLVDRAPLAIGRPVGLRVDHASCRS